MDVSLPYSTATPGSVAAQSGRIDVAVEDVVDAAVGVGVHPTWHPAPRRWRNAFDARWRINLLSATLDWSIGEVCKTGLFADLDPSEKGFASYHIGMTFALVWARKVLGVPDLAHVDRLLQGLGYTLKGRRPDLIGDAPDGTLFAIEAKGRSGNLGGTLASGKRQIDEAEYWFSLAGKPAVGVVTATYFNNHAGPMRMATATYFDNHAGPMRMAIKGPVSRPPTYDVDENVLRAAALEPYAEVIATEPEQLDLDGGLLGSRIGDTGVVVALAPEVQEAMELVEDRPFRERSWEIAQQPLEPDHRVAPEEDDVGDPDTTDLMLQTASLPGGARYRRVGSRLGPRRSEASPVTYREYEGRVSPNGVAILVDDRWRPTAINRRG